MGSLNRPMKAVWAPEMPPPACVQDLVGVDVVGEDSVPQVLYAPHCDQRWKASWWWWKGDRVTPLWRKGRMA